MGVARMPIIEQKMSESSSPAACPDGRATNMDAEAEAEAQADAESERLVRDIVLCQARAIGSSDKKRSRSRKPKPKSSSAHSSTLSKKRGNTQTSVGPSPQMSLDDSKLAGCFLPKMNDGAFVFPVFVFPIATAPVCSHSFPLRSFSFLPATKAVDGFKDGMNWFQSQVGLLGDMTAVADEVMSLGNASSASAPSSASASASAVSSASASAILSPRLH